MSQKEIISNEHKKLLENKRNKDKSDDTDSFNLNSKKKKMEINFNIENIKRRKILISFTTLANKVKEIVKNNVPKKENEFLKIFSLSDINPEVNFLYFKFLMKNDVAKYNKYINKYKYTLNYKDAKSLGCFKGEEEEITKLENFYKKSKINSTIKEINSLSKIKIINFLYQLNDYYKEGKKKKDFKNLLLVYKIKESLKFKLPNNYGNYELQLFTFLKLFLYLFNFEDEDAKDNITENEDDNYNEEEYLGSSDNDDDDTNDEELLEFKMNDNIEKINKFNSFISSNKLNIAIPNKNLVSNQNNTRKNFEIVKILLQYLNGFDKYITNELIIYDKDDNIFLKKIDFIYFTIIYFIYNYDTYSSDIKTFKYSLYEPKVNRDKAVNYFSEKTNKLLENYKEKELLNYTQLFGIKSDVENMINNPFNNIAIYFLFPLILSKNIITFEEHFFNSFKDFIFEVYQSKLMKQIFYVTEEFKDYYYPFDGKEKKNIFDEMFSNTSFFPLKCDQLHGYTCKIFTKVIISTILKDNKSLEHIIISISYILNTIFHEQAKHYIKSLIHYNSIRHKLITPLDSDNKLSDESFDKYLKIVKKKKELINVPRISKDEMREILFSDGGDKLEILLYGQKLERLFIKAALNMLCKKTYDMDITEHLENFINDNRETGLIKYDNFVKDEDEPFLKDLFEFIQKYCNHRISKQTILDGTSCLQTRSNASQDPGSSFLDFKRINIREYMGTS